MEGISTFRSDYLPYHVTYRPIRVQEEYKPTAGEMDMATTYRRDYNPHKIEPIILVKPVDKKRFFRGKLNAVPTYQADYRAWGVQKKEPKKVNIYQPPNEKFGNVSTFQDAFVPKEFALQKSFKPTDVAKLSDQPFISVTSHRSDYIPHPLEPKWKKSKEQYRPSSHPFDATTTHRCDFRGLVGAPPKPIKPESAQAETKACFDGTTEFRDRFQPWTVSLPELRKAKEYVPPTGSMDLSSTSHLDYIKHNISPVVYMKPLEKSRRSHGPFQGNTTMKDAFPAWDVPRSEMVKKPQEMVWPSDKFDGTTTFQTDYTPPSLIRTQSCKPPKVALSCSSPFEDETMYRMDYTPKQPAVCPATYPSPPGYVFVNKDSRGHKFFRKVTPDVSKAIHPNDNHVPKEIAVLS